MASVTYNSYKLKLIDNSTKIDLSSNTIKIALVTSSYVPVVGTHTFYSDITSEVVGTGYVAGGNTLGSKTTTQDNVDNEAVFDAADTSWTTSTITARGAVIYKDTGAAATSPLLCYIDFGQNYSSVGGTFAITFNSEGIININ